LSTLSSFTIPLAYFNTPLPLLLPSFHFSCPKQQAVGRKTAREGRKYLEEVGGRREGSTRGLERRMREEKYEQKDEYLMPSAEKTHTLTVYCGK